MVEEGGRGRTIPEIPEAEPLVKSLEGSQTLTVRHPYVDDRPLEDGLPRLGEYQSSSALAMELSWANCSAASGIGDLSNIRAYLIYGQCHNSHRSFRVTPVDDVNLQNHTMRNIADRRSWYLTTSHGHRSRKDYAAQEPH